MTPGMALDVFKKCSHKLFELNVVFQVSGMLERESQNAPDCTYHAVVCLGNAHGGSVRVSVEQDVLSFTGSGAFPKVQGDRFKQSVLNFGACRPGAWNKSCENTEVLAGF